MNRKTNVKPHRRKNSKSKGKHRVRGHTRNVGHSKRSEKSFRKNGGSGKSYTHGHCGEYALALSKVKDKPIYIVRGYFEEDDEEFFEDGHAVVKLDDNLYEDVKGKRSAEDIINETMWMEDVTRVELEKVSEKELKFIFNINDEDISELVNEMEEDMK